MLRQVISLILTVCLLVHMGCATTGPASRSSSQDKRPVVNVGDRVEITLKDGEVVKGYVQRVGRSSLTLWRRDQRTGWKREIAWKDVETIAMESISRAEATRSPGLVVLELVMGSLAGLTMSSVGSVKGRDVDPCYGDDCISAGQVLGFLGGSAMGSFAGVSLTGRLLGEQGSYGKALVGSIVGTSSIVVATLLAAGLCGECAYYVFVISDLFLPAAGATIGFNWPSVAIPLEKGNTSFALPRRPMPPLESRALLHMEDDNLRLGIPSSTLRPLQLSRNEWGWEYQITLVSMRF